MGKLDIKEIKFKDLGKEEISKEQFEIIKRVSTKSRIWIWFVLIIFLLLLITGILSTINIGFELDESITIAVLLVGVIYIDSMLNKSYKF